MSRWLPLEANPEVMNKYLRDLGVPKEWNLVDVLGVDKELLQLIPKPVVAVLLLFPVTEKYEQYCKEKDEEILKAGTPSLENIYFIKQSIKNACGTIALIHAIANNKNKIELVKGSPLEKFLEDTQGMAPEERGAVLEKNEEISSKHSEHALLGQTSAPSREEDEPRSHFVTLINIDGDLYDLDGRKRFPVRHGSTSPDSFIEDAANLCKQYMERDPGELNFSLVALTAQ